MMMPDIFRTNLIERTPGAQKRGAFDTASNSVKSKKTEEVILRPKNEKVFSSAKDMCIGGYSR